MKTYKKYERKNKPVKYTEFVIVVPTQNDKNELLKGSKYIHNLRELNTEYIVINQLAHLYLEDTPFPEIVVDEEMFNAIRYI
jgi:hypothetical protein